MATVPGMHHLLPVRIRNLSPRFPKTAICVVLTVSFWSAAPTPRLRAAETLLLPETVVTASRTDEDSLQSMSSIGVVTAEQFQQQGYRTIPEALTNTGVRR